MLSIRLKNIFAILLYMYVSYTVNTYTDTHTHTENAALAILKNRKKALDRIVLGHLFRTMPITIHRP